jgi:Putative lactococcus lactis phage r1t holin
MFDLFSATFWADAGERAMKSFVQGIIVGGGLSAAHGVIAATLTSVPWLYALNVGALMAVISVMMSVVSAPIGSEGTASVTNTLKPARASQPPALPDTEPPPVVQTQAAR